MCIYTMVLSFKFTIHATPPTTVDSTYTNMTFMLHFMSYFPHAELLQAVHRRINIG